MTESGAEFFENPVERTGPLFFQLKLDEKEYSGAKLDDLEGPFDTSKYPSLYSSKEVLEQTGINLGELTAIVRLPYSPGVLSYEERLKREEASSVYCFKDPESGRHALPAQYYIVGGPQLEQLANGNDFPLENIITLDGPGDNQIIGREHWMPSVGYEVLYSDEKRDEVYEQNPTISRQHMLFQVSENGGLLIQNLPNTKNKHALVTHGILNVDETNQSKYAPPRKVS